MKKPTDFAYYLSRYLCSYLPMTKGVSGNTIKTYTSVFKLFCEFMNNEKAKNTNKITVEEITKEVVSDFLDWIENSKKCSINTRNQRRTVLRSFMKFIQEESPKYMYQCQMILTIPKKKAPQKVIDYLSIEGMRLLLNTPDKSSYEGRKHAILLTLIYASAARVSEIVDLEITDFKYNGNNLIKLTGKGKKSRLVPLEPEIVQLIEQYLIEQNKQRGVCNAPELMFLNHSNGKLTRQGVTYILKKYIGMANKEHPDLVPLNISVHGLRHSRAIHWLQAGVDLIYIRDLLGHTSVSTTEVYIRIDNKLKAKALKSLSPENFLDENQYIWHQDKNLLEWLKSFN
jgi:site-specific recombinase XerD